MISQKKNLNIEKMNKKRVFDTNRKFYDYLWSESRLIEPECFNTWSLVQELIKDHSSLLEIGPGLRPRLPIHGTSFVDISDPALNVLSKNGGLTYSALIGKLPFKDKSFDLVCALDIIEHVDDISAISEIARVTKPGGTILISTPLYMDYWSHFDEIVGHYRRYEPDELLSILNENAIKVHKSAIFGMKLKSSKLQDIGLWFLKNLQNIAMPVYNKFIMPIALKRQSELNLTDGLIPTAGIDEIFLVCRLND